MIKFKEHRKEREREKKDKYLSFHYYLEILNRIKIKKKN